MMIKLLLTCSLFFSLSAHADEAVRLLFGPEFTFDYGESNDSAKSLKVLVDWSKNHLIENQPKEAKFYNSLNKFVSPDGWSFVHKTDIGVIETTMEPLSREDFAKYADNIQDAIFVSAYNIGYFPQTYLGGGHINMSAKYFLGKPNLFRNFIVDLLNHSELGLGVWNYDTNNSYSPALMKDSDWAKIRMHLQEYDEIDEPLNDRIAQLAKDISEVFSKVVDPYNEYWREIKSNSFGEDAEAMMMWATGYVNVMYSTDIQDAASIFQFRAKYTAINLKNVGDIDKNNSRIELRMFRAQPDMNTFLRQITLIEKRIQYLESLGEDFKLELNPNYLKPVPEEDETLKVTQDMALSPPIDPQLALREYYKYVTEAGEKWEDHQSYLWPDWIQNGELDKFNASLCENLFGETS